MIQGYSHFRRPPYQRFAGRIVISFDFQNLRCKRTAIAAILSEKFAQLGRFLHSPKPETKIAETGMRPVWALGSDESSSGCWFGTMEFYVSIYWE